MFHYCNKRENVITDSECITQMTFIAVEGNEFKLPFRLVLRYRFLV